MSIQISGPVVPPDGTVTAPKINSGAATVGFVLTADGVGGADFDELPAAGGGLLASGATVGATAQRQIFTTGVGVGASPPDAMLGVIGADSLGTSFAGNISGATGTGLVITNAGNVGIGTTAPNGKLSVQTSARTYLGGINIIDGANTNNQFNIKHNATALTFGFSTAGATPIEGNFADVFSIGYTGLSVGSTYAATLAPSNGMIIQGNVGIGTTSPTAALHLPASSTARASLRIPAGTAPTSPNAGDVWAEGTVLKFFNGTITKEIAFV